MLVQFERLEEAARQAERDAIALPRANSAAGLELQQPRFGQGRLIEAREQLLARLVLVDEAAREDIAVAGAVLQRDAPAPACIHRRDASVGRQVAAALGRNRKRAVARKPLRPVVPADVRACSPSSSERNPNSR